MNYGYDTIDPVKDQELAADLGELLADLEAKDPAWPKESWKKPYIEVDQLYRGVRIRKITNLSDEQEEELIEKADDIYAKHTGRDPFRQPTGKSG